MRILVVDDDPTVRDLLQLQLELAGHDVASAQDGAAGLAAVERERPDLLVLDVMMPELSGWEVLERLREDTRFAKLPVVLVTARDLPDDRERARQLGAFGILAKPHDPLALERMVDVVASLAATRDRTS